MAKFRDIQKGTRARKPVALPLGERTVMVDVRILGPDDDLEIAAAAFAAAKAKGVAEPGPGNAVYDLAERNQTALRACVDNESPANAPEPFFASIDELLDPKSEITRDHLAFLVEEQARFQDETSPRARAISPAAYISLVAKTAEGQIGPFAMLAPIGQWSFVHSMAKQLFGLLTDKSPPSSPSEAATPP